jgi:hypothetical protein
MRKRSVLTNYEQPIGHDEVNLPDEQGVDALSGCYGAGFREEAGSLPRSAVAGGIAVERAVAEMADGDDIVGPTVAMFPDPERTRGWSDPMEGEAWLRGVGNKQAIELFEKQGGGFKVPERYRPYLSK